MVPKSMTSVFIRGRREEDRHRGEDHVKMESMIGEMQQQVNEFLELPEAE